MVKVNLLSSFPKPSTMKLASCNLINIPAVLKQQDTMTILDLSNSKIASDIPKWIWRIGTQILMNLNLSYNFCSHMWKFPCLFSFVTHSFLQLFLIKVPICFKDQFPDAFDYSNNNFPLFNPIQHLRILIPPSACHLQTIVLQGCSD